MFTINSGVLFPFCELASKFPVFGKTYNLFVRRKINKYLIDPSEIKFNNENVILKDDRFFNYKILNSSGISFVEINGFKMVIKTAPHLMIGDVELFDLSRRADFIDAIDFLSKIVLAKKVQIIVSKNHWLYSILFSEITPVKSLPIGFYKINKNIDYSKISFSMLDYDTF